MGSGRAQPEAERDRPNEVRPIPLPPSKVKVTGSAVSIRPKGRAAARRCLDGWPSGLRRTIGNRVGASPRGFESHSVRRSKSKMI